MIGAAPSVISNYIAWWSAAGIVVLGLLVYGIRDVLRFSIRRSWAISSVCFAESIRRRVLWITPLAVIGVIIVSQLQHPLDELDAIRQTTKFCLFACGLLVTITAIILACTNLPREIDSRVIYTIVTKPTTRLEIVLGKVLGFARVSATILLIMGVFSFAYLEIRAASLRSGISQRLEQGGKEMPGRPTLEHYKQAGLLSAKTYAYPVDLQIYSRLPVANDERRYMFGGQEGQFIVPFIVPASALVDANQPEGIKPLALAIFSGYEKSEFEQEQDDKPAPTTLPYYIQNPAATTQQVSVQNPRIELPQNGPPTVQVEVLDRNLNTLVDPGQINGGRILPLTDPQGTKPAIVQIGTQGVAQMLRAQSEPGAPVTIYVQVTGTTPNYEYFARETPIMVLTVDGQRIGPMHDPRAAQAGDTAAQHSQIRPTFHTRTGTYGMQLRGAVSKAPMALFKFRDAPINPDGDGNLQFELKVGIERSNVDPNDDQPTELTFSVIDRAPGAAGTPSPPSIIRPETNRTSYIPLAASLVSGGNFDIVISARSPQQYVGITARSLMLVDQNQNFGFNLFKSLFILWLLAILVVIVSVFSSTFVSWPIAIVLTLMILLSRWGVMQLGDSMAPGIGNLVVQDLFRTADPNVARTVSTSVEALTKLLNLVTSVLPDISRFSALEDMERGVAVPMPRIEESLAVIALFGIPLMVLSYVRLRQKEVAP